MCCAACSVHGCMAGGINGWWSDESKLCLVQCSPRIVLKFAWQSWGDCLCLCYSSSGILGCCRWPLQSLLSGGWLKEMLQLYWCHVSTEEGEKLHAGEKAKCLSVCWYHPSGSNSGFQHSCSHWKPPSQHAHKELTKNPPSFLCVRC